MIKGNNIPVEGMRAVKKTVLGCLMAMLLAVAIVGYVQLRARIPAQVVPKPAADRLLGHIRHLSAPNMQGRAPGTKGFALAGQYIADNLAASGLAVKYQPVTCYAFKIVQAGLRWVQKLDKDVPIKSDNVIGVIPGKSSDEIIASAHYDHLGAAGRQVFLGANDNASGEAVLLETARAFASDPRQPKYTLVFASWTGEEQGFLGSREFARINNKHIRAVINMDCVGNSRGEFAITGKYSHDRQAIDQAAKNAGVTVKYRNGSDPAKMESDHIPFEQIADAAFTIYSPSWLENNQTDLDSSANVNLASLEQASVMLQHLISYYLKK